MNPPVKRLGLTMRIVPAEHPGESRDALAHDWGAFLAVALPEVSWLPVPNLGAGVLEFAQGWNLDGFIFTGGNDLGAAPRRDQTEWALLNYAHQGQRPVFGVCRGLQFIQQFFGGPIGQCARERHVDVTHPVVFDRGSGLPGAGGRREVNSFHQYAVPATQVAGPLRAFATTADGWAEGLIHREAPITAVQWHPERCSPPGAQDMALLRHRFGFEVQASRPSRGGHRERTPPASAAARPGLVTSAAMVQWTGRREVAPGEGPPPTPPPTSCAP